MNIDRTGSPASWLAVGCDDELAVAAIALPRWFRSNEVNAEPF
jgi:hypothetical protein